MPTTEWQGKSGLNRTRDFVMETDWAVGEVLEALDKNGLADNTLVIFTSDNGCSPQAKFDELQARATTRATSSAATRPTSTTAATASRSSRAGPAR